MSKKKTILEESTIRRFMKLASIDALTENYFDRERPVYREEEDEFPAEEPAAEFGAEEEAPVDDFAGDEAALEGPAAAVPEEAVKEIVDAIAAAVSEVTGTAVDTVGGEEEAPVDDMGAEAPVEEPPMDMGAEEEAPARRYEETIQKAVKKAVEEALQEDPEKEELDEEATDDAEDTEVKEEAIENKADLREEDDADEELEEADDDADDNKEVKTESKKRRLTEEEMVSYITKRVAKRISELAKKK